MRWSAQTRAAAILAAGTVIFFAKLEFAKFALATRLTNSASSNFERLLFLAKGPKLLASFATVRFGGGERA